MSGSLIKGLRQASKSSLEVDWSVISGAHLGLVLKALFADFVGAPPPLEWEAERLHYTKTWRHANVQETYFHKNLATSLPRGSLIRAVIYDMPSLIQSSHRVPGSEVSPSRARDWTTLVDVDVNKESEKVQSGKGAEATIQTADVIENLGLKGIVPGLMDRIQGGRSKTIRKPKLEDFIGKVDGIRAKYADKIRTKKILADVRREQRELGITSNPAIKSTGSKKGWKVLPGSPVLVRYLEARGLPQGLIARGQQEDLDDFLEQIGNYQFQHISRVLLQEHNLGERKREMSSDNLKNICESWGLLAKQILLVLGEGHDSEALIRKAGDLGFFICQVRGAQFEGASQEESIPAGSAIGPDIASLRSTGGVDVQRDVRSVKAELQRNRGLRAWFRKLASGTLDADSRDQVSSSKGVHFTVADMIELKWVVEDLNGVSYRRNTMIPGLEEMVRPKK